MILGFSFTGYLLPWDQKAYWATMVGTRIAGTVPFLGNSLMVLIRGGLSMLLLPRLDRSPSRHPARRRWGMDVGLALILMIGLLTLKGILSETPPIPKRPMLPVTQAQAFRPVQTPPAK